MSQSKNWMFTWNNPPYDEAQIPPNVWPDVKWGVWQHEKGEQGTPHYQGYVVFVKNTRLAWLVANLPEGIHWDLRRGTHEEAKAYCMKKDTRYCDDDPDHVCNQDCGPWFINPDAEPKQGKRSDLAEVAEYIKTHNTKETAEAFPSLFIRNYRGLMVYRNVVKFTERADDVKTELIIYWGVRGSGKSHMAKALYPGYFSLMRPRTKDGGCWWDGYEQQDTVLIDEFFGWLSPDLLCRLNDKGKAQVETKFGFVPFNSKRIVMTSNKDPWHWWSTEYHGMVRRLEEANINYFPNKLPTPVPAGFEPAQYTPADPKYPARTDAYVVVNPFIRHDLVAQHVAREVERIRGQLQQQQQERVTTVQIEERDPDGDYDDKE